VSILLAGVRAGYGAVQLLWPDRSAEQLLGGPLEPAARTGVRVLGARQLAQAGLTVAAPTAPLLAAGAGIDALHALSMAVLAVADRRWRRPAVVSGLTAAAFAACGALAARRAAQAITSVKEQLCSSLNDGAASGASRCTASTGWYATSGLDASSAACRG
jgi:hypothetical protein